MDDDTYILTLATIAKELKIRGLYEAKIHLAVGLPLKWVKAQREDFRRYMLREKFVDFKYKEERYKVEIVDCTVMPQCYAAVAEKLKEFKGMNLLVDIGNGTMNLMYLNNGRAAEKTVTKQDYQRMTDAFMKLWNQAEKERNDIQNRNGYQRMIRR